MGNRPTNQFIRILRLWRVHAYLDFLWMTRDLKYFLICYVADGVMAIAAVTGMYLLAERFQGIEPWTKYQFFFLLGYGSVVRALVNTFFGFNIYQISRRLGRGQLDHTLIQPQPIWMSLLTEGFTPFSSSVRWVPGLVLICWSLAYLPLAVTPMWMLGMLGNLFASGLIMISFAFIWGSLAFWAPRAAEEISTSAAFLMEELVIFPLNGIGPVLLSALLTALPIGFLAWFPCQALLRIDHHAWNLLITPAFALLFALLTALVFRKGMNYYVNTGSSRYSDFGHRR